MSQTWVTSFHRAGSTGGLPSGFASAPVFSPGSGSYVGTQSVSITSSTPLSFIYYTLDGSIPTTSSLLYIGPVSVSANVTITAIAVAAGFQNSLPSSATYILFSLTGETLPGYTPGVFYSQNIAGQAAGGVPPLTFTEVSETGVNVWFVDQFGNITGVPGGVDLVTDTGAFLVTDTGAQLIT